MNPRERGFLLLSSQLGDPNRRPLTVAQLRTLAERVSYGGRPFENRDLECRDLVALGYGQEMAERIVGLLAEEQRLDYYLRRSQLAGCRSVTRVTDGYPVRLRQRLGLDAPGCLWLKGDASLLELPAVALVGSRDIRPENRAFASEVGYQAARQGYALVSGNARGADRIAQEACLASGGCVISVVADELVCQQPRENMLYVSEDSFDLPFSTQRALSRNRVIHSLGQCTYVAQSSCQRGGTWDGTVKNLRAGWTPVFCFNDGAVSTSSLIEMGAEGVGLCQLHNFGQLVTEIEKDIWSI